MSSLRRLMLAAGACTALTGAVQADEVTHWNGVLNQAIRVNGGPPCPIGRGIAMMNATIYDAVNSITRTHQPYFGFEKVDAGASKEAAVAAAAHSVLVEIYPAQAAFFDSEYATRLALIPAGPSRDAGVALGQSCAG